MVCMDYDDMEFYSRSLDVLYFGGLSFSADGRVLISENIDLGEFRYDIPLPINMCCSSSICLDDSEITKLPLNLSCMDLEASKSKLLDLSNVKADRMWVYGTQVKNIDNIDAFGLNIDCTGVKNIPYSYLTQDKRDKIEDFYFDKYFKNQCVFSWLTLERCVNVETLPSNGVFVLETMDLEGSGVKEIPRNTVILDTLYLNDIITDLPDDLVVLGSVVCSNPENFKKPKGVYKIISLWDTSEL